MRTLCPPVRSKILHRMCEGKRSSNMDGDKFTYAKHMLAKACQLAVAQERLNGRFRSDKAETCRRQIRHEN